MDFSLDPRNWKVFQKDTPPTGEIAANESIMSRGFSFTKYNPDSLVSRKGLQVYEQMSTDDDQVRACLNLKKNAVLSAGWFIEPASDSPRDIEIQEYVDFNFNHMDGTLNHNLKEVMSALNFGYSVTEKVWELVEEGRFKGKVALKALKTKKPQFYTFDVDEFSNLKEDGLILNLDGKDERLPIDKFVIYSYQKEFGNWYGKSDLRSAYRNWWSKDNIIKFWNIFLERFGMPIVKGMYKNPSQKDKLQEVLDNLQTKSSLTFMKGDVEIDFLEAQRQSGGSKSAYEDALIFHNKGISNAILVPSRIKDDGEGGARAEASVRFEAFLWVVEELRREIEEAVVNEQIVRDMVKMNFGDVEEFPKFRFKATTKQQEAEFAKLFIDAVKGGAVTPTFEDESHLRDTINFPEVDEDTIEEIKESRKPEPKEPIEEEPVEEEPKEEEMSVKKFAKRTKENRFEKGINFGEIEKTLKSFDDKLMEAYQATLTKQKDSLISTVSSKYAKGELSTAFILSLDLKFKNELKQTYKKFTNDIYRQGVSDGTDSLPKDFATAKQGIALEPTQALSYLNSKADFVVKGINDPLLKDVQNLLVDAIATGIPVSQVVKQMEEAYNPYLSDGTVIIDDKAAKPFRLEAVARTTINESYNWGRRDAFLDPELEGFVIGLGYSEILDDRTTQISRFVDGKAIDINSPFLNQLSYPLHFNERGVFVPVTVDEKPVEFMSDATIMEAIGMKKI